ncbi:possible Sensor with Chase2 domain [Trichormus variabilis ATCC 29413]|uniref:Possible Sensor with Chase2 domain n=1 Tax=Trichormus variabilis (strain ATCC 29413 / PCC 7937) TaxID=240292 RepID=Q3M6A3_TRIV2|nr:MULTISPECIES: CHASE2 domain-containing protein [Nostocaceae]ABA23483.1 possible Sensor with Chase2 domain [Trichormus variabilis ATCC 29413]MBC1270147.1 CHASE2 domain-containing protein [Trichormus variabilis FSR]MBD2379599.1 CHASE2 domain-containing protein [Trichormus variabilis FACHB-319]QFZ15260.1 CHASE2 domain-containing protein [Anabaena sp. YBS01]QHD82868.1 CHASE2 domain-containing protein [Trichormus variabilis 0441]
MAKLVVLKFGDGSFEQGFTVTLQIGEESDRPSTEITGKLPPCPEILLYYSRWQSTYLQLGNGYRLDADKIQVTNVSVTQDCHELALIVRARFNTWLQAQEFRPLREKWLEKLQPTDEIRVILQSENSYLQRLPWHIWDLLERYPKAEIALSSPSYELIHKRRTSSPTVNILAIVGNSQGIDTHADQAMLQNCPNADVSFLVEPQRKELTDHLWGKSWDILFFAGHSSSQGDDGIGRIYLNQTDSLSISELKYALKQAIARGLQLAIFNSRDGLGLAKELADLNIPQIIVMREPVPDQVAQEFLKYFLLSFANGESLYQAVRHARERLQGLEDRFPCATWLPVICQNPAQKPLTWEELTEPPTQPIFNDVPPVSKKRGLKRTVFSSLLVTAAVYGLRFLGALQTGELQAFDQMMRSRPDEGPDPRILIVTIDDEDLAHQRRNNEYLKGTSISEKSLNLLLAKISQYQPKAIGLDIYRDFHAEQPELISRLRQTENLIGICKGSDTSENIKGIESPPEIPQERLGFSDFVHDDDGVVRRHLLFMSQETASLCSASYAFSSQLAFRYLSSLGIQAKFTSGQFTKNLKLGDTVLHRLSSRMGAYQNIDANGGQILLNYRAAKKIAEQVTLTQLLSSPINPNAIKDRIILIGVVAKGDFPDYWATPYGHLLDEQMPGVMVQAHMVSQIISAVLDGRSLLRVWLPGLEIIWIGIWAGLGGFLAWRWRLLPHLALAVGISSSVLYLLCLSLLVWGFWVPFVPSALSLVSTVTVVTIQNSKFLEEEGGRE